MEGERIFISVIVPVYNSAGYLRMCTDAILGSGVEDLELILVDDGSTDGSSAICDSIASSDSRVLVSHTEKRGVSEARNTGIEMAQGEYLCFLDSDDYIDGAAFRKTTQKLGMISSDVLASDFYRVGGNGTVLDRVFQIPDTENPICGNQYRREFLSQRDTVWNVWRYIYRREYIERYSLRFAAGVDCGEDLEFSVAALMLTDNTAYYHNPYYHYRVNYAETLMHRITVERVSSLMRMLVSVYDMPSVPDTDESLLIRRKISREYILNLTLYAEAATESKEKILGILTENRRLIESASGIYLLFAEFTDIFGLPFSSHVLLVAKKIKRGFRRLKVYRGKGECQSLRNNTGL